MTDIEIVERLERLVTDRDAEIVRLKSALGESTRVLRDSLDAIEQLYSSLANALGESQPGIRRARALLAEWAKLAGVQL